MLLLALGQCTTMTGTAEIDAHRASTFVACNAFRSISWSTKDTVETIIEVKGHNAAFKETCG